MKMIMNTRLILLLAVLALCVNAEAVKYGNPYQPVGQPYPASSLSLDNERYTAVHTSYSTPFPSVSVGYASAPAPMGGPRRAPGYEGTGGETVTDGEGTWIWDEESWTWIKLTSTPNIGDEKVEGSTTYVWNGYAWEVKTNLNEVGTPIGALPWILIIMMAMIYLAVKLRKTNNMTKKFVLLLAAALMTIMAQAIPAYRGWIEVTQPDGTVMNVRLMGDEYFHFWENESGERVVEDSLGFWNVVPSTPAPARAIRRAQADNIRRVGKINLAPRGLVILVNYSNVSFQSGNTRAVMNDMMNGDSYTYNGAVGSVKRYFSDQSAGSYTPVFDVVGPYTLSQNRAYYGANDAAGNDVKAGDMIVEACRLADGDVNFAQYDNDGDGKVDFVYVIYAGVGEADSRIAETIWPHNWTILGAYSSGSCSDYNYANRTFDGKLINDYACSGELRGGTTTRAGIGTLCHEFSHVLGLPDLYPTIDGVNDKQTPSKWHLMDYGSYNNNGNTPPNYSVYDKYYLGWISMQNLGTAGRSASLTAGNGFQINDAGSLAPATSTDEQCYVENRQQTGWDQYLPSHGAIFWRVRYDRTAWNNNTVNNLVNNPRYTMVSSARTNNGNAGTIYVDDSNLDPFPGKRKKYEYTPFEGKPITGISESGGTITFTYINATNEHSVVTNGSNCTINPSRRTVPNGTTLTAVIEPYDRTYDISTITITLGATDITASCSITPGEDGEKNLTIPGASVTGSVANDITITATATKNRCQYVVAAENASASSESGMVNMNAQLQLTIAPAVGYIIEPSNISVKMGGVRLSAGTGFTYSANTFTIAATTADVDIIVSPSVDPTAEWLTFIPLNDLAMLQTGQKVIVASTRSSLAGQTLSAGSLNSVFEGFEKQSDGSIKVPGATTTISIFTLGGSTGQWTFTGKSGQLLSATADALAWGGTNKTWTIALGSSTASTVLQTATGNYRMYYNSANPLFRTSSTALADIKLYVTAPAGKQANSITFEKQGAQTTRQGNKFSNIATAKYGTVTYSSSNPSVATVDSRGVVTAIGSDSPTPVSVTITATVAEGQYYLGATASYTLTISPTATVSWSVNGVVLSGELLNGVTTLVIKGERVTALPPAPSSMACSPSGAAFLGWSTTSVDHVLSASEARPAVLFSTPSSAPTISSDVVYYAVFGLQ